MTQRVPARSWGSPGGRGHRIRLLVEDDDPVLAISDFSLFREAGFDVALCSGPGRPGGPCPLIDGRDCDVVARADVVLHGLGADLGVAAAVRARHPDIPLVLRPREPVGTPPGAIPGPCTQLPYAAPVGAQLAACFRAATRRPAAADRPDGPTAPRVTAR